MEPQKNKLLQKLNIQQNKSNKRIDRLFQNHAKQNTKTQIIVRLLLKLILCKKLSRWIKCLN